MREFYDRKNRKIVVLLSPREKYHKAKAEVDGNCHLTNEFLPKGNKKLTKQEKAWRQGYRTAFLDMVKARNSKTAVKRHKITRKTKGNDYGKKVSVFNVGL